MDNPAGEQIITVDAETDRRTVLTAVFFFPNIGNFFNLAAVGAIVEKAVIMPKSTFTFIITALLAFAEIKSQGKSGFPFQTHPQAIMVSVTSLLLYGFASAIELVVSAARLDSVYAMIARLESARAPRIQKSTPPTTTAL